MKKLLFGLFLTLTSFVTFSQNNTPTFSNSVRLAYYIDGEVNGQRQFFVYNLQPCVADIEVKYDGMIQVVTVQQGFYYTLITDQTVTVVHAKPVTRCAGVKVNMSSVHIDLKNLGISSAAAKFGRSQLTK